MLSKSAIRSASSNSLKRQSVDLDPRPVGVLVIEDHAAIAQMLSDLIDEKAGYECLGIAYRGADGLLAAREGAPDIVLLDLLLPDMGGLELLQELRKGRSKLKILVYSALANVEVLRHSLRFKVDGFVEKGATMDQLFAALDQVSRGGVYLSPKAAESIREVVLTLDQPVLNLIEMKALRLLAQAIPIKEIAFELGITPSGAYKVVDRLHHKTASRHFATLSMRAVGLGLTSPSPKEFR
jgi:DNA-binding NarL/FixJ family response regulator